MNFSALMVSRWTLLLLAVSMLALTSVTTRAAAIAVSPSSVSSDYNGRVTLSITGLAKGQAVVVEKFADFNGNNTIDPSDLMVQSFRISDDNATSLVGVRNSNIPGDDDGEANGQVRSEINFQLQEADRASGKYIYRTSPTAGGFDPVTTGFAVSQPPYPQKVTGRVISNGSGVSNAMVALLNLDGNGGFVAATSSDASGNFDLGLFGGTWHLQLSNDEANDQGFIGPDVVLSITDGTDVNGITYVVRHATAKISGTLRDSNGQPLSNVLIYGSANVSGQTYRVNTDTDASGSFRIGVFNATWMMGVACTELEKRALNCVQDQAAAISGNDRTIDFVAQFANLMRIDTQTLPSGSVGSAYFAQIFASGGSMPRTWTLMPGSAPLPPGLVLSSSGIIQGIPSVAGANPFVVSVMDGGGQTVDKGLLITIAPANVSRPSFMQPEVLPNGRVYLRLGNVSAGQTYTIESSDDLKTWISTTTITAVGNLLEFTDDLAPNLIRRFYRARSGN